jgi:hypothetical protein
LATGLLLSASGNARADYASSEFWFNGKPLNDRAFLQGVLILVGRYTGLADGVFRQLTYDAIVGYQTSKGWSGDGVLTAREELSLQADASAVFSSYGFRVQTDAPTGLSLPVPERLLPIRCNAQFGSHWESSDGDVELETLLVPEERVPFEELYRRMSQGRRRQVERCLGSQAAS